METPLHRSVAQSSLLDQVVEVVDWQLRLGHGELDPAEGNPDKFANELERVPEAGIVLHKKLIRFR